MTEPVFRLPPHEVDHVFATRARGETVDWGLEALGVPGLWSRTRGRGVRVAVLDTGCALTHPDLEAAVVAARDFTKSKSKAADVVGHGTHVAGVIAARENGTGVVGVAPECGLVVAKVLGDSGAGTVKGIVAGIDWALERGARVLCMSLGSPKGHADLEAAIGRALAAGVIVCAAAGNEGPRAGTVGYPARYTGVVSVAAVGKSKSVARFSSRGERVDVAAPGDQILSCYPPRTTARMSGTSMACPFVAGLAALVLAADDEGRVRSAADFLGLLRQTSTDIGPDGRDQSSGWGLVHPEKLLAG